MAEANLGIVVRLGQRVVATHALTDDVVKIGRLANCKIPLTDDSVSRMHAVLERSGDAWRIIDLGSSTGTRVGGHPVNNSPVAVGDVIGIGPFELVLVPVHELAPTGSNVASAPAPAKPSSRCPSCGSAQPRIETELHTSFTAPDLAFDTPNALDRVRAELCRDCGHIALFLRDRQALVPRE